MPTPIAIPGTIKPGRVGSTYLTLVFEFAHRHEGWKRLKDEARERAFADMTSIWWFVEVKIQTSKRKSTVCRARPFANPLKSSLAKDNELVASDRGSVVFMNFSLIS